MLHLFSKKAHLTDLISGMPDIHNHVLPGIDDGASTEGESIILLKAYKELGITTIIATPHSMGAMYENTPKSIENAWHKVNNRVEGITLHYSSEYMLDDYFESLLESDQIITLKHNYVLIELSFYQPPINLGELLFKITSQGFIPVLAHPERYAYYHKDISIFEKLRQKGCLLQLNALSLSNHYGVRMQRVAHKLLEKGSYSFIGTDTHRIGHLTKLKTITISRKHSILLERVVKETTAVFN